MSAEGFRFDYPPGWVVAFDRSGSSGNGAVVVVGDFRALVTVSVFRTETIPTLLVRQGLTQEAGYNICVEPQQRQDSTMRFQLLRSEMVPPAGSGAAKSGADVAGGADAAATAVAGSPSAAAAAYEFEFSIESCAGEIEEGIGGKLRCLSFGANIPSQRRRHIGRCVLANGKAFSLNASSPEDRWAQIGPLVQAVVSSFRA